MIGARVRYAATMGAHPGKRTATWLYATNVALLTTHQDDAAYWREWDVFGVPGGLPVFLAFNVGAVALVAAGLVRVAEGAPSARRAAALCATLGLFTVAVHAVFLWLDRTAFWEPASLIVLFGVLATSVAQLLGLPAAHGAPVSSPEPRRGDRPEHDERADVGDRHAPHRRAVGPGDREERQERALAHDGHEQRRR